MAPALVPHVSLILFTHLKFDRNYNIICRMGPKTKVQQRIGSEALSDWNGLFPNHFAQYVFFPPMPTFCHLSPAPGTFLFPIPARYFKATLEIQFNNDAATHSSSSDFSKMLFSDMVLVGDGKSHFLRAPPSSSWLVGWLLVSWMVTTRELK